MVKLLIVGLSFKRKCPENITFLELKMFTTYVKEMPHVLELGNLHYIAILEDMSHVLGLGNLHILYDM